MKNYMLFVLIVGLYYLDNATSMVPNQTRANAHSQETYFTSNFDNSDEADKRIQGKKYKFDTEGNVLEAAKKANEKSLNIFQKLLIGGFCGIAYTLAMDSHQRKLISPAMTEILLRNEHISLNEILYSDEVNGITFEGTEKHWADFSTNTNNGNKTSFAAIMDL